ncbi:PREDICTED: uncharacterized protein LOC108762049 [Trachymyrmex cornetzi]|uniref:uncharacterized protein LOC108762049 n=1 Tax=Trachymyrmex cornetzi TaxID=471704 RepID=UPI00084F15D6|nr:PREDICTED: uncharacterized protein LOC108762049 [Trachymyrmex cornetzi]
MESNNAIKPPEPLIVKMDGMPEAWKLWIQRYEWYAIAVQRNMQKKHESVQAASLMTAMGADAAIIYNSFNLTEEEATKTTTIKARFAAHFAPTPSQPYVRLQFNNLRQTEGETFDSFLTKARTQIKDCGYNQLADELLRDKIIFGVQSKTLQQRLLEEDNLTLERTVGICKAWERATKQVEQASAMSKQENEAVNAIKVHREKNQQHGKQKKCIRCGRLHGKNSCPAMNKTCLKCTKVGHFANMCRTKEGKKES